MLIRFFKKAESSINQKFQTSTPPVITFGIFGLINFPLFYLVWHYVTPNEYSNFTMRFIAAILCLFLILKNQWPKKLKFLFPIFWYVTVIYSLPFFCTYMFLKNYGSVTWLTNTMLALFWLILVMDWISFMIVLPIGITLGGLLYYSSGNAVYFLRDNLTNNLTATILNFIWAIVIAAVFTHNKEKVQETKLQIIKAIGASIAHELRTPLRTISLAAGTIKHYFPALLETFQLAKKLNLPVPLNARNYENLLRACDNIESETQASFTIIDMLLVNVSLSINASDFKICSINHCIDEAMRRYPFDMNEAKLVHWDQSTGDFLFKGNQLLIIHVFFNLMKNALYQTKAAEKGNIYIWIDKGEKYNLLHFKDTAKGIPSKILPYVFDRFFTRTYRGTGVGLAFCKVVMENLGGKITCNSVEHEFAEFILYFPNDSDLKVADQLNQDIDKSSQKIIAM